MKQQISLSYIRCEERSTKPHPVEKLVHDGGERIDHVIFNIEAGRATSSQFSCTSLVASLPNRENTPKIGPFPMRTSN